VIILLYVSQFEIYRREAAYAVKIGFRRRACGARTVDTTTRAVGLWRFHRRIKTCILSSTGTNAAIVGVQAPLELGSNPFQGGPDHPVRSFSPARNPFWKFITIWDRPDVCCRATLCDDSAGGDGERSVGSGGSGGADRIDGIDVTDVGGLLAAIAIAVAGLALFRRIPRS